jgi:hypothetical protein
MSDQKASKYYAAEEEQLMKKVSSRYMTQMQHAAFMRKMQSGEGAAGRC